jgi:hypothetical protein
VPCQPHSLANDKEDIRPRCAHTPYVDDEKKGSVVLGETGPHLGFAHSFRLYAGQGAPCPASAIPFNAEETLGEVRVDSVARFAHVRSCKHLGVSPVLDAFQGLMVRWGYCVPYSPVS